MNTTHVMFNTDVLLKYDYVETVQWGGGCITFYDFKHTEIAKFVITESITASMRNTLATMAKKLIMKRIANFVNTYSSGGTLYITMNQYGRCRFKIGE